MLRWLKCSTMPPIILVMGSLLPNPTFEEVLRAFWGGIFWIFRSYPFDFFFWISALIMHILPLYWHPSARAVLKREGGGRPTCVKISFRAWRVASWSDFGPKKGRERLLSKIKKRGKYLMLRVCVVMAEWKNVYPATFRRTKAAFLKNKI